MNTKRTTPEPLRLSNETDGERASLPSLANGLLAGVRALSEQFDDRLVFLGGVAVYLHVVEGALPRSFVEPSDDGDFYVSLADFADLRDLYALTVSRPAGKHSFRKNDIDFDVYVESQTRLPVPYAEVARAALVLDGVRIANLEHLLVMKLAALADRQRSAKGRKDERDLVRIGLLLRRLGIAPAGLAFYLGDDDVALFASIERSSQILALCEGDAPRAERVRAEFEKTVADLARIVGGAP